MEKKALSAGQLAYEAKRAARAGMPVEKWLASKDREAEAEARARAKAAEPPKPARPPGLFKRLIDRAHQPLKVEPEKSGAANAGAAKAGVAKRRA